MGGRLEIVFNTSLAGKKLSLPPKKGYKM